MATSFNAMCERLGCTVEDGHQALSAESPDGRRIVFSVPEEQVDWTTRTCILLAPAEQQPHESRTVSVHTRSCAYRAELCVTDPAIEALGVVLRGKPAVTGAPDTGSADAHSVLRLRVLRLAPGHYCAQILTVIFIGVANEDGAP